MNHRMQKTRPSALGRRGFLSITFSLLAGCIIFSNSVFNSKELNDAFMGPRGNTGTHTATTTATPSDVDPALIVQGRAYVISRTMYHGTIPLSGVKIFLKLGQNPAELIGITLENGKFTSKPIYIQGNELVRVWAEKDGLIFRPKEYAWGHNRLVDEGFLNFKGESSSIIHTPIPPPDGVQIRGGVWGPENYMWLDGVRIMMAVDSNPAETIALTQINGKYESPRIQLAGNHRIRIWAVQEGYTFEPGEFIWHHPKGFEEVEFNFRGRRTALTKPIHKIALRGKIVWGKDSGPEGMKHIYVYAILLSDLYKGNFQNTTLFAMTDQFGWFCAYYKPVLPGNIIILWPAHKDYVFNPKYHIILVGDDPDNQIVHDLEFLTFPR